MSAAFVCGGIPTEHDLDVIRRFGEALALPTKAEQRAALYAMSDAPCPSSCPCLCHDVGTTAEHGAHPRCPTKDGLPLVDPRWTEATDGLA